MISILFSALTYLIAIANANCFDDDVCYYERVNEVVNTVFPYASTIGIGNVIGGIGRGVGNLLIQQRIGQTKTASTDPTPTGGAKCIDDDDCGGFGVGKCTNMTCKCSPEYGNSTCSYKRKDGTLAGALNIALPFVGVCGVGNFIIDRIGRGVGQIILIFAIWIIAIPACCIMCICGWSKRTSSIGISLATTLLCIGILAALAGFIWSIVDGALMLQGKFPDGNGYNLYL